MTTLDVFSFWVGGVMSAVALYCVFTEGDYLVIKLPRIRIVSGKEKEPDSK